MLSNRTLKFLYLGCLLISSAACKAEEKKDEKKDEGKALTVNVNADATEHVNYNTSDPNDVVLTADSGYHFKTLKAGEKVLYTVDTNKFTPTTASKLKKESDVFFKLLLSSAKPLLFKKKTDTEWTEFKYGKFLDEYVFKGKEAKDLDVSKFGETSLFTPEEFGTGKLYTFTGDFKVKNVLYESKKVGDSNNCKFTDVKLYVSSDNKKVVRLNYFYTGDDRFKEVFFEYKDDKWKKADQTEVNKTLHAMNESWLLDYKPTVDKFSPLAVLSSLAIVAFALFYYL